MPKMKTKKTFAKRVKVTGTGKLRKYSSHLSFIRLMSRETEIYYRDRRIEENG